MKPKKKAKKSSVTTKKATTPNKTKVQALVFAPDFWKKNWIPALILFCLGVGLYVQTINYDFVLDDKIVITDNNYTKKGFSGIVEILTTESFQGYFGQQYNLLEGGRYRPLSIVTFAIEYGLFGLNAKVSHFVNILLYGLTGILLFRILTLFFPMKEDQTYWYLNLGFVATALFLAHPVHSEVVANIKGRDEILTLLGALAAMYYSLKYVATEKNTYLLLSCVLFFLALLSKENALTFLAIIPLSIYFFSTYSFAKIAKATLPLLGVAILYLIVRTQVIGYLLNPGKEITNIMNNPFYGLSKGEELATVFYTLGMYIKLSLFPHPLTHDYYPYHVPVLNWGDFRAILSLLVHLALGVYAVLGLRNKNVIAYGILFYLITLSIVSNVVFSVGAFMNERFIYISSIGVCIILAYFIAKKLPEIVGAKANILNLGLLAVFMLGFMGKTVSRIPAWKNSMSLNEAAIKVSPNSCRANCFMGTALFQQYKDMPPSAEKEAMLTDINYYINEALRINPNYGSAMTMKSGVVAELYKRDNDLEKLLNEFYALLSKKRNLPFIETYLKHLGTNSGSPQRIVDFCYQVSELYRQKNYRTYGLKYVNIGLGINPADTRLLNMKTSFQ
ncbi:MAG: hypothetical protein AB8G15_09265 [Saprospiraceae bacterium]